MTFTFAVAMFQSCYYSKYAWAKENNNEDALLEINLAEFVLNNQAIIVYEVKQEKDTLPRLLLMTI